MMASSASTHSDGCLRWRSVIALGLCAVVAACGNTYSSPEWSARVIDKETGAPIEGAIVVVRWELERYSGSFAGWLLITEAVTDKDGIFHVSAWGPLNAPSSKGRQTRVSPNMPNVDIFKSGYRTAGASCCGDTSYLNDRWNYGGGPPIRNAWADGKVIALQTFQGSMSEYRDYVERAFKLAGPSCIYIEIPRIFAAAVREDRMLKDKIGRGVEDMSLEGLRYYRHSAECPKTIDAAIGRYLK